MENNNIANMPVSNNKSNEYALLQFRREQDGTQKFQTITFYEMFEDGSWENGTTLEELLRVAYERLTALNTKFPCRENSLAITKIQEAIMWLETRTKDRVKRGVEGQHKA